MNRSSTLLVAAFLVLGGCASRPHPASTAGPSPRERHDVVLLGGRVMDPESGLDAVRNVGIRGGRITTITEAPITGATVLDARGLVVAPGFIDLHQHAHDSVALRAKVIDGVTAAFELELGVPDVDAWYDALEGRALIHYGATVGHACARMQVLTGSATAMQVPTGEGTTRAASNDEIARIRERLQHGLRVGALGVGLAVEYTPGADVWEVLETFRAAAAFPGAGVYVHVRGTEEPYYWMETASGARSVLDIGDPQTALGVRRIVAASPYHQFLPGARQPALLLLNGGTDYTVPLWMGAKFVARARRTAGPGSGPLLFRVERDAGHSGPTDFETQVEAYVDDLAFALWQLGHPDFQPRHGL